MVGFGSPRALRTRESPLSAFVTGRCVLEQLLNMSTWCGVLLELWAIPTFFLVKRFNELIPSRSLFLLANDKVDLRIEESNRENAAELRYIFSGN